MSRTSSDEIVNGHVKNGYDYQLQCWVKDFTILNCGHLDSFGCHCVGREFQGQDIRKVYGLALFYYQA